MKKILLATVLFLSIGLMASAQQNKTKATIQPTQAPVNKQERNKQQLVSQTNSATSATTTTTATTATTAQQAKIAKKNAILKARENNSSPRSYKKTRITAKTKSN